MRVFFVVLARDTENLQAKIKELDRLGYPYLVVCGEKTNLPNVAYREPKGKYDAINYGMKLVPAETEIVAFNDVDTVIHNFDVALKMLHGSVVSLVYAKVQVEKGPQQSFYSFLDKLRDRMPLAASGELMLVWYNMLKQVLPLKGCKAEDSYILFSLLEKGAKAVFCKDCYVTTKRTSRADEEEQYKRRTVGGIYQALSMTKPPKTVKFFYILLPLLSPLLLLSGKKGYYWTKGILLGYIDYIRGDKTASWKRTYNN